MKLDKVMAQRTDKTVYRDGDKFSRQRSSSPTFSTRLSTKPAWKKADSKYPKFATLPVLTTDAGR